MLETLKEYWYFFLIVVGGIFRAIQLLWKWKVQRNNDVSYAVDKLLKAKNTITTLTLEVIDKEGENAELYKAFARMRAECPDCFQGQLENLPQRIVDKILKNIGV